MLFRSEQILNGDEGERTLALSSLKEGLQEVFGELAQSLTTVSEQLETIETLRCANLELMKSVGNKVVTLPTTGTVEEQVDEELPTMDELKELY